MKHLESETFGQIIKTGFGNHFVRKTGNIEKIVWIEPGLGGLSAEWWAIQDKLSQYATVITYDRLGYGWSGLPSGRTRTPSNIADEINALLNTIGVKGKITFIGHSQGGINLRSFLKKYPERCRALLLLDPLSPNDRISKTKLPPEIYRKSGFEKAKSLVYMKYLAQLRLLPLLKSLIMKSPPFYYFKEVSSDALEIIWQSMLKNSFFKTMIDEYKEAHIDTNINDLRFMSECTNCKISVLYHDPRIMVDEIVQYGGLNQADAKCVDDVWKEIMSEYCTLSKNSEFITVENATHYIHMSQQNIIINKCLELLH